MNVAVILASGKGERMRAKKNKVLLDIEDEPIVSYSACIFNKHQAIEEIIIVCLNKELNIFQDLAKSYKFNKVSAIIEGGKERQDSAFNAVKYLKKKFGEKQGVYVLFHNAANPFVSEKEITDAISAAKKYGACAVAHPAKDTIKFVKDDGIVKETLDRSKLWNMQTPQVIELQLAFEAFSRAKSDNFMGTDDVSLVERLGKPVKIAEASQNNFKITTPLDLELAKIIFRKRKNV
ncbi:MAG: 2-C-methyl-D-erythritol 4-phosphate cytidylyltransferase [Parcubacteria group bacterium]|jgi:2-C-methyl-D-erythritol 4-phosphate cytidylyltransferase